MSVLNYGNLKAQGEVAKKTEGEGHKPLTEGQYSCVFMKGERTVSKSGNSMFVTTWGVRDKSNIFMHKKDLKIRTVLAPSTQFQVDRFLSTMIDLGVDLDKVTCDKDWDDVFDELLKCKAIVKVYYDDKDKEPDGTVKDKAWPEFRVLSILEGLPFDAEYAVEGGFLAIQLPNEVKSPATPTPVEEPPAPTAPAEKTDSWD